MVINSNWRQNFPISNTHSKLDNSWIHHSLLNQDLHISNYRFKHDYRWICPCYWKVDLPLINNCSKEVLNSFNLYHFEQNFQLSNSYSKQDYCPISQFSLKHVRKNHSPTPQQYPSTIPNRKKKEQNRGEQTPRRLFVFIYC